MIRKLFTGVAALLPGGNALADWGLTMPRGVTGLSAETYAIHMVVFWWCVAIAVIVFAAMIYSLISHRKSTDAVPTQFSHSMTAEVIWTTIPVIILLVMVAPSARMMINLEDPHNPNMAIVVTAYQGEDVNSYSNLPGPSTITTSHNPDIDAETVENFLLEIEDQLIIPRDTGFSSTSCESSFALLSSGCEQSGSEP